MACTFRSLCASIGQGRESTGYINDFVVSISLIFLSMNVVPTNIFGSKLEKIPK